MVIICSFVEIVYKVPAWYIVDLKIGSSYYGISIKENSNAINCLHVTLGKSNLIITLYNLNIPEKSGITFFLLGFSIGPRFFPHFLS